MFFAQSLHGAAVSMCAPRVVAVIAYFTAAANKANDTKAVEESLRHLRAAVDELAGFLRALENGVPPSHAMMRQEVGTDGSRSPRHQTHLEPKFLDLNAIL